MTSGDPVLLVEDRGPVRIVRMNRPDKLNALNTALIRALHDALQAADEDDEVRALVLAGAGRGFCFGAGLSEFGKTAADQQAAARRSHLARRMLTSLHQMSKPIVSVVQGAAVGAGAALAIGCDMLVAGSDIRLGYPEVQHAMVPGIVMPSLQRQIGGKLAFEMISLGRLLTAEEVMACNMANRVANPQDALEVGMGIASRWADTNALALSASKALFYRVADLTFDEATRTGRDISTIVRGFRSAN
jgi:enoyl-CoA hydratase/carnithine racemase